MRSVPVLSVLLAASAVHAQVCDRWVKVSEGGYTPSDYHHAVYDAQAGHTLMVATNPSAAGDFVETWAWDGSAWTKLSGSGPARRYNSAMAYDADRGRAVLAAGHVVKLGGTQPDTWEWDGVKWTEVDYGHIASVRGHEMAYDSWRGVAVLWGGSFEETFPEKVYEWDGVKWKEHLPVVPSPAGRGGHAMAFDAARGVTVMYGGAWGGLTRRDLWEWDGEGWTLRVEEAPLDFQVGSMLIYDSRREVCVLYGGNQGSVYLDEMWEWDGMNWRKVPTAFVAGRARRNAGFAYDADRGVYVLAGGYGRPDGSPPQPMKDTWEYRPCDPDCDRDCDLDVFDYLCFQDKFASGSMYADFERDGDLDVFDFLAFLDEFVGGCP